jgi:serine/threonine protein kinase
VEGEIFLVMDYVPGDSLSRLIRVMGQRGERIAPRIALGVVAGMLQGLHAAPEAKDEQGAPLELVHRDVSPQNAFVGTDGVARHYASDLRTKPIYRCKDWAHSRPRRHRRQPLRRRMD